MDKRNLEGLLFHVVDETLRQVFKEAGTKAIYVYLEKNPHLRWEEIVEEPEVFSVSLKRLLGSGSLVIEKRILKSLYSRLKLKFKEKKGYGFSDHIKELRKRCSR